MTRVYLSPSAQIQNAYAGQDTNEQAQCNRIAEYARKALEKNGFTVNKAPQGQGYTTNTAHSNTWDADVHIAIHTNAGGGRGCEVYAWSGSLADRYVKAVYAAVDAVVENPGRGIKIGNHLHEITATKAVCVYVECEFHDNVQGAKWIMDNAQVLGEAIARGVCTAEGRAYRPLDEAKPVLPPPKPPDPAVKYFRVRTSWADAKSQIGAYVSLENARRAAAAANPYKVYDSTGKQV